MLGRTAQSTYEVRRSAERWTGRDVALVAALWLAAAAGYLVLAVTSPEALGGEEASVSMRDVLFTVEQRVQASVWSTNWVAPAYYWLASHLDPSYSPGTGRQAKAVAMALLAPLVYATLRLRLACGRPAAVLGGALVVLLPGTAVLAPVATENGLEAVVGLGALLVATSRRWWPAAPVLGGLAVGTYTAGLAWAGAVVVVVLVAVVREPRRWWQAAVGLAAGVGVVALPLWWWTAGPERIVVGGGRVDGTAGDLGLLVHLLVVDGDSYYWWSHLPALGSAAVAALAVLAAGVALWRRPGCWPWLLAAVATVALWMPAGNLPGTRRVVALVVVAAVVLAVAGDVVAGLVPDRVRRAVGVALAGGVLCGPLVAGLVGWAGARPAAPADWPAPAGPTMAAGLAQLDADLRAGRVALEDLVATGDSRAAAMVWLLAERRGDTAGLPGPEAIARARWAYGQEG